MKNLLIVIVLLIMLVAAVILLPISTNQAKIDGRFDALHEAFMNTSEITQSYIDSSRVHINNYEVSLLYEEKARATLEVQNMIHEMMGKEARK